MKHMLVDFALFQNLYPQMGGLVVSLLKGTAVILMAAGVAGLLHGRSARVRNWVWRSALAGLLGLTLWQVLPAEARTGVLALRAAPASVSAEAASSGAPGDGRMGGMEFDGDAKGSNRGGTAVASWLGWMERGIGLLWVTVAAILMARHFFRSAAGGLWLRRHSRKMAPDPVDLQDLSIAAISSGLEIRTSQLLDTPLLAGLFRPSVYLPEGAGDWPWEKRRSVLLHEMAHWSRKDLWWQFAGTGVCCLWWWNPLAWMALSRMKAEAEQAADDLVVLQSGGGESYARLLVEIASGRPREMEVGISMLGRSPMEQRLLGILGNNPFRNTIGGLGAGLLGALSVLIILCMGAGVVLGEVDLTNGDGDIVHYQADPADNRLSQGNFKNTGSLNQWTGSVAAASSPEKGMVRLKADGEEAVISTHLTVDPSWKWLTVSARTRLASGTKLAEGQEAFVSFTPVDGSGKELAAATVLRESNREGYTNWIGPIRTIPLPEGTNSLKVQMTLTQGPGQLDCSGVDVIPSKESDELDHRLVDKFYEAVRSGEVKSVDAMLSEEPRLVNARRGSADNGTPLILCAWMELPEVAQVLVDHGADLKATDYGAWRSTALTWCGWWGSPKTAGVLLKAGADPKARSIHGVTPLSSAKAGKGSNKASKAAPQAFDETIALFEAAEKN